MTECQHPDLPHLSALDLRPVDLLILRILRTLCAGLQHGRLAHWMRAFDMAEEHLGTNDGPMLVSGCISLLRAIRAERAGGFGYMSEECPHISQEEQDLLELVRAGACTQPGDTRVADAARRVATISDPLRLISAARAIGALCARHESLTQASSGGRSRAAMHLN